MALHTMACCRTLHVAKIWDAVVVAPHVDALVEAHQLLLPVHERLRVLSVLPTFANLLIHDLHLVLGERLEVQLDNLDAFVVRRLSRIHTIDQLRWSTWLATSGSRAQLSWSAARRER